MTLRRALLPALLAVLALAGVAPARAATTVGVPTQGDAVVFAYSEKLDAYSPTTGQRYNLLGADQWINGQICIDKKPTPQASRLYVGADPERDYNGQHQVRQGWVVYDLTGKVVDFLTFPGQTDTLGCAIDSRGNLFGTNPGGNDPTAPRGFLVAFFKDDGYNTPCILERDLPQPGFLQWRGDDLVMALAGSGTNPSTLQLPGEVREYTSTPRTLAECLAQNQQSPHKPFISDQTMRTPMGLAHGPDGTWTVSSVAGPPSVAQYDANGAFLRYLVPPGVPRNPMGVAYERNGSLFYVELALGPSVDPEDPSGVPLGTIDNAGALQQVSFLAGQPLPPKPVAFGDLSFADGVSVFPASWFASWVKPTTPPDIWSHLRTS